MLEEEVQFFQGAVHTHSRSVFVASERLTDGSEVALLEEPEHDGGAVICVELVNPFLAVHHFQFGDKDPPNAETEQNGVTELLALSRQPLLSILSEEVEGFKRAGMKRPQRGWQRSKAIGGSRRCGEMADAQDLKMPF